MYNYLKVFRPTLVLLFLVLAVTSCFNRKGEQAGSKYIAEETLKPGVLFNGKSLMGWEITNFGPQGPVFVSGNEIILGMGDGCTGITWTGDFPETDYEVSLEAKRMEGNDFFCGMTFPAGKDPCTLIVGGWGGTVVGLSCIDGMDASENETTSIRKFDNHRWYAIRLNVSNDSIKAWIDSEMVVSVEIAGKKLSVRPEVELSRPFGVASWRTKAALRNMRLVRF
ncbi:MAG: family 16 glycoside hydrolase [Bacteroidales bacterium]|jgi:hypothetical protein